MTVESRSRVAVVIFLCAHLVGTSHADDPQPTPTSQADPGAYVFLGALAVKTGFTIYDLADDSDAWIPASLAIWTGALAAHGIYTLAQRERSSTDSSPRVIMLSLGAPF